MKAETWPCHTTTASAEQTLDVIEVLEERLTVTKEVVETGSGIRLRKVIHEETIDVTEPLSIETLQVKRLSINREVNGPIAVRYEGDVTIFSIVEERLITRKQLVLLEEVHVGKVPRVDKTTQQTTLRREELIAERQDAASGEWSVIREEKN